MYFGLCGFNDGEQLLSKRTGWVSTSIERRSLTDSSQEDKAGNKVIQMGRVEPPSSVNRVVEDANVLRKVNDRRSAKRSNAHQGLVAAACLALGRNVRMEEKDVRFRAERQGACVD